MTQSPQVWQQGAQTLCCIERRQETADAVTLVFRPLQALAVSYQPGQFLLLTVEIDGQSHSRAYSLSSSPSRSADLAVTVKRVSGGLVSNWLLDHFHTGDTLNALAPTGAFFLPADYSAGKILLCSAGSGITPMMSMAHWLLETQPGVTVHFFHSARDEEQVIFSRELHTLAAACPRLKLHLFLSRPQGLNDWYSGRIDATRLRALLPESHSLQAFLCGQEGYMAEISAWLSEMGVPEAAIRREHFAPAIAESCVSDDTFRLKVPDFGRELDIARGESLLEVLESAGLPIIGACRTGVCGSCKCRLVAGKVSSSSTGPLSLEAQAAGYVLACSSQAESDLHIALA